MKYMGSKRRIWKDIAPIILRGRRPEQLYVEPFCGGCNSLVNVDGRRLASDCNPYLIAMYKSVLNGEKQIYPIPRETYNEVRAAYRAKDYSRYSMADIGFVGFMASFNGRFFDGGYSGIVQCKDGATRNYVDETILTLCRDIDQLKGVEFRCCSYDELDIPEKSIIYCDPPYKGRKEYSIKFNHEQFYEWCFRMKEDGHEIFISEYWMPSEFTELWSKGGVSHIGLKAVYNTEKLFTL